MRHKKVLAGLGVTVLAAIAVAGALYLFGSMEQPTAEVRAAYAAEVAAGRQPAIESRFTIPIPGCVCHGSDPVLQMRHSVRRIGECGGCHSRS